MSLVSDWARQARWLFRSSTLRLTLLLSTIIAIGMAVAIIVSLDYGRDAVIDRLDASLVGLAEAVEADDATDNFSSAIIRPVDEIGDLPPDFRDILDEGRGTVYLDKDFRRFESWRVLISTDSEGEPILIAVPLDDTEDALEVLAGILWTAAAIVLGVALLIGLVVGLLAQRRLVKINGTLHQLASGDLKARTGVTRASDDLDDLARELDDTAAELERLVAQTRHLSSSIAHDLRTPLARLRARLEMLPESEERGVAIEEASRLSDIFDTIMRVARIEAAHGKDGFERVDLAALSSEIEEIFSAVVEDSGKTLKLDLKTDITVDADRNMLIQAMANLIQNAIVHGGDEIVLFADGASIGVADDGAGVDPSTFGEIIKPMVRGDAARESEGSGLGLALVRAVADRHNAELVLSENTPKGLRVALNFAKM